MFIFASRFSAVKRGGDVREMLHMCNNVQSKASQFVSLVGRADYGLTKTLRVTHVIVYVAPALTMN